ncbi:MAG: flavodoxin reductase [Bacteroidetes bacterium]|nr:flavodoxin reductase [Bacteroidota bacterium]
MEQEFVVRLLETRQVTHNVKRFRMEKPEGYSFRPGQATDVCVNRPGWQNERRPFTFTCLTDDPYLEFTIKRYPDHHGVTDLLHQLEPGDELLLHDVWGAIDYRGPGCFIAGGAGITPFLAILRELRRTGMAAGNTLYFSNRTAGDVIQEDELRGILGDGAHFILSREIRGGYEYGRIDQGFLTRNVKNFKQPFYICGPDEMVKDVAGLLEGMGASAEGLVFEK